MSADIFLPFKLCGCNHFVSSLSCILGFILPKMIMIGLEKIKLERFFRLTTKNLFVQPDLEKANKWALSSNDLVSLWMGSIVL